MAVTKKGHAVTATSDNERKALILKPKRTVSCNRNWKGWPIYNLLSSIFKLEPVKYRKYLIKANPFTSECSCVRTGNKKRVLLNQGNVHIHTKTENKKIVLKSKRFTKIRWGLRIVNLMCLPGDRVITFYSFVKRLGIKIVFISQEIV